MDDFLHNLRSGKLKQADRQNRSYGDQQFKGGPRRNMMDRRKQGGDNKEVFDRLQGIKEVLETLAETQKRLTNAYIERTRTEERKAKAMEVLARHLYRVLNPKATEVETDTLFESKRGETPQPAMTPSAGADHSAAAAPESTAEAIPAVVSVEPEVTVEENPNDPETPEGQSMEAVTPDDHVSKAHPSSGGRLTEVDRHTLYAVINQMRSQGNNWESIARHIAGQGYPTVSGKGVWRGVMVKSLFEKMAGE